MGWGGAETQNALQAKPKAVHEQYKLTSKYLLSIGRVFQEVALCDLALSRRTVICRPTLLVECSDRRRRVNSRPNRIVFDMSLLYQLLDGSIPTARRGRSGEVHVNRWLGPSTVNTQVASWATDSSSIIIGSRPTLNLTGNRKALTAWSGLRGN